MKRWLIGRGPAALFFAGTTAVAAHVQVPIPGAVVPISLQTVAVVIAPIALGPAGGTMAMLLYLVAGVAGLPVFAGGRAGLDLLLGSSGGYLAGFVLAQFVVGYTVKALFGKIANWRLLIVAALAGHGVILLGGLLWLGLGAGTDEWSNAFMKGVWPFLPGAAIKSVLVVLIGPFALNWNIKQGSQ